MRTQEREILSDPLVTHAKMLRLELLLQGADAPAEVRVGEEFSGAVVDPLPAALGSE